MGSSTNSPKNFSTMFYTPEAIYYGNYIVFQLEDEFEYN